jgi:hypothetical protein
MEQDVEDPSLVSYASAIYRLRWNPPKSPTRISVWSDGRVYPAHIEPLPAHRRKIGKTKIDVRGYAIRGVVIDGEPAFEDKIDLYFARDDAATPVEIVGKRSLFKVRVQLTAEAISALAGE